MKKISVMLLIAMLAMFVVASVASAEGPYPWDTEYDYEYDEVFGYYNAEGDDPVEGMPRLVPENAHLSGVLGVDGFAGYDRSVPGQNVHTNFQKNTNSCASCHMTHTAANAALLFRDSVSNACQACHDGSLGRLDVWTPSEVLVENALRNNTLVQTEEDAQFPMGQAVSGTFGVVDYIEIDGEPVFLNSSIHMVDRGITNAAAPGGNVHDVRWDGTADVGAQWGAELTCAGCHDPHGSHSMRLLRSNPNNISTRTAEYGGIKVVGANLTVAGALNHPYTGEAGYRVNVTGATGPWIRDLGYTNGISLSNGGFPGQWVNYNVGYIWVPGTEAPVVAGVTADVARAVRVRPPTFNARMNITYTDTAGYNRFCGACHTDYDRDLATSSTFGRDPITGGSNRSALTGIYSKAHRHSVRSGGGFEISTATCVSCHFVHGADALIMKTADEYVIGIAALDVANDDYQGVHDYLGDNTFKSYTADEAGRAAYIADNRDVNPSSALKRYTNMAACWKCHGVRTSNRSMFENQYWIEMEAAGAYKYWNGTDVYSPDGVVK